MLASKWLVVIALASQVSFGSAAARRRRHEYRGAEVVCAATGGGTAYFASGSLYKSFTPSGMAYRNLRKPLLSGNQRVAVALAAAAVSTSAARAAITSNGPVGDAVRQLGISTAGIGTWFDFESLRERSRRRREQRERAARQEWLKENTKPARVLVPK